MSQRYDKVVPFYGTYSTPSNNDVLMVLPSLNYDFLVIGIQAVVRTAGATTGSLVVETYAASPANIHTLAVGTSAQYTSLEGLVVADNREQDAGTEIAVTWDTTDGSAVGDFVLWITPTIE